MITVHYGRKELTLTKECTVRQILKRLEIEPEGVIIVVNDELPTSDRRVLNGDRVQVVRAISGGASKHKRCEPTAETKDGASEVDTP